MSEFRLVLVEGEQAIEEWPLAVSRSFVVGRYDRARGAPDVDLSPDATVSRRHARVWFEHDCWWLEDLGSAQGTHVGTVHVHGGSAIPLQPGEEICIGRTRLVLFAPGWHRVRHRDLLVEVGLGSASSYLLARSACPLLSRLTVSNASSERAGPFRLDFTLGAVGQATAAVPTLEPGERRHIELPKFRIDYGLLECRTEHQWQPLGMAIDGENVPTPGVGCWLLAHNEWSSAPEHWNTLAAFVLPNHPSVVRLASEAVPSGRPTDAETTLRLLYEHLCETWRIAYRFEPPSFASGSQKVRLPHDVLSNREARNGQGTCLDLALLVAGGLEALQVQPLVAVVDLATVRHALVGCWRTPLPRLEPLLDDADALLRLAVWVDPNGCSDDPAQRAAFDAARLVAQTHLRQHRLLFALDVAAARFDGITPLPFAGEPQFGESAAAAIREARRVAEAARAQLAMVPLLVGLLRVNDDVARRVFRAVLREPTQAALRLEAALAPSAGAALPSQHVDEVLAAAKARAKAAGSPVVHAADLLGSLLDVQSSALDTALRWLGIGREEVRGALRELSPDVSGVRTDPSLFSAGDG